MSFFAAASKRHVLRLACAALFLLLVAVPTAQPSAHAADSKSGTAIPFATPDFEAVWSRYDRAVADGTANRSWLWGPTALATEHEAFSGARDGVRVVQYFDKARMELNEEVTDPASPWRVTTGLLVDEMVNGRVQVGPSQFLARPPSSTAIAGDESVPANPRYADFRAAAKAVAVDRTGAAVTNTLALRGRAAAVPSSEVRYAAFARETQHNIAGVFWDFLTRPEAGVSGGGETGSPALFDWVYVMGYPITEPYWVTITVGGRDYSALVQLFQRRLLTYVAEFPDGWRVQMGNVGRQYHDWRYGNAQSASPSQSSTAAPAATPQANNLQPATGGFVGIAGDSFTYAGQEVKLKGTNYWLSQAPFVGTWSEWNGPRALAELEKARDLGVNTIRIGIPFDHRDTMDVVWDGDRNMTRVSPWIKDQMTQFLQVASIYGMKVIFVLYEWYDKYAPAGSREERPNIAYLEGIISEFKDDDRVLAWDLHNEPDFYDEWQGGHESEVISWLARRAADIRFLDKKHPITVGVGNYASLWKAADDGTTILSFVDFVSFHCYNAGALSGQIAEIKRHTSKPVVLGEMGWPTALGGESPRDGAVFDEATQRFLYKSMLADSKSANIAGVLQWTLWDYWGGQTALIPGHERYFGLVRQDGSFKPAAEVFRSDYTSRIMPSDTKTYRPLDTSDKPNDLP